MPQQLEHHGTAARVAWCFTAVVLLAAGTLVSCTVPGDKTAGVEDPFRVVSYNVWVGFQDDTTGRKAQVAHWLQDQQPDVVALQELNGFTARSLRTFAAGWAHPYVALLKEDGYPTGLTSRTPITNVERVFEGLHHGYLYGETAGVAVAVVHLSPFQYQVRRDEAARVLEHVQRRAAGKPVLVLGDFNALSPHDSVFHTRQGFVERMAVTDRQHDHVQNLVEGRIDYEVLRRFYAAGLEDLKVRCGADNDLPFSSPTEVFGPANDSSKVRIDYILASEPLARTCVQAGVNHTPALASDHYPVVADFAYLPPDAR